MFEIIAIIIFSEKIAAKARLKGYPRTGRFVLLFVSVWFIYETIGYIIGSLITPDFGIKYIFGLGFAIFGGYISFIFVDSLKTKELKSGYDPTVQIELPFEIVMWKENIIAIAVIFIISFILMYYISIYMIIVPILIFLFSKYAIYKIIFEQNSIIIKYFYGRKKLINKNQIVRIILNNKLIIELNWKKSSKHSTKVIKFSSNDFLVKQIPLDNIKMFFQSTYSNLS